MGEVIITVHGTGDSETGEAVNRRDENGNLVKKWWEPGSDFETQLLHYLGDDFAGSQFQPFIWSGENSERDRRKAAGRLLRRLKEHDAAGDTYHLIGHSHGGSVIAGTIAKRGKKQLAGLQSVTSVATPFINFAYNRFSSRTVLRGMFGLRVFGAALILTFLVRGGFSDLLLKLSGENAPVWVYRVELAALAFIDRALTSISVIAKILITVLFETMPALLGPTWIFGFVKWFKDTNLTPVAFFLACLIIFGAPNVVISAIFGNRLRAQPRGWALEKWQSLWHRNDEAIRGLAAAKSVNIPLFRGTRTSDLLGNAVDVVLFLGLLAFFLGAVIAILVGVFTPEEEEGLALAAGPLGFGVKAMVYWAFYRLLILGVRLVLDFPVRQTVGRMMDGLVSARLRGNAYGNDVGDENVERVTSQPRSISVTHAPLPEPIQSEMTAFVNKSAVETVGKLRDLLGSAAVRSEKADLVALLSSQLSWDELIHTTYFDNRRFAKLAAYAMLKRWGRSQSAALRGDPDFPEIEKWYAHVSGEGPAIEAHVPQSRLQPRKRERRPLTRGRRDEQ